MPNAAITSANDEPERHKPMHERKNGPWDEWELDDAGRHIEKAEQIKANPKLVAAVAKHHEKKAAKHHKIAAGMKDSMKRGLVSETALTKASIKNLEADRKNNHG